MASRATRARRLLVALSRSDTRPAAARRVRRVVAGRLLRGTTGSRREQVVPAPKRRPRPKGPHAGYPGAWSRLASIVLGAEVAADPRRLPTYRVSWAAKQAKMKVANASLAEALAQGEPLERAVSTSVDSLTRLKDWNAAWSLAEGIRRLDGGAHAAAIGFALIAHRRRQFVRVWQIVAPLDDGMLATYLPVEAVDAALFAGTPEARNRAVHIASTPEQMKLGVLVDLAGRFLVFDEPKLASAMLAELGRRPPAALDSLDERRARSRALIEAHLERQPTSIPGGAVAVGVIDYQTPDQVLASGNLGDYVQTLAMLGNLVRTSEVTFSGDDGLGDLATELQGRVRSDLRLPDVRGSVHLVDVNREFTSGDDIPAGTWMVAFGWHMHPLYDVRYDFPYHENIRPLFVSFHVNRLDMLSEAALDYLRTYGPVGCRDLTTVDLLLSAGVDAFFTGCLTTTVDAVFPARADVYTGDQVVGVIDRDLKSAEPDVAKAKLLTHQADEYRHMSLTDGVHAAVDVLSGYQRGLERVVTPRLHAYLPLTALGVPVDFRPWSPGDVRFPGLLGLTPGSAELGQMQQDIRDLISAMLTRILEGADERQVYEHWRELTADRVAQAKAQFRVPVTDQPTTIDVRSAVDSSLASARAFGPHDKVVPDTVTDVVLCLDQNLKSQAAVTFESILDNAGGPLRLWVLGRGLDERYQDWFAATFPTVPITFLSCDHVDYGDVKRIPARITVSTMDRLLLPHLLEDVERVIYLDVDTLVLGDMCELADLDLEGHPIAARDSNVSESSEWRVAARRLPQSRGLELQRRMGADHGFGNAALNAGVLVLDLARMRRDDFTRTSLGWVETYGFHDQDVMLAYTGADRCVLDPRWNALPVLETVEDPAVIHWASLSKPWAAPLTYEKELWQVYAERLRLRAPGPMPDA